jgi:hypothetical protein
VGDLCLSQPDLDFVVLPKCGLETILVHMIASLFADNLMYYSAIQNLEQEQIINQMTSHAFTQNIHDYLFFISQGKIDFLKQHEFSNEDLEIQPIELLIKLHKPSLDANISEQVTNRLFIGLAHIYMIKTDKSDTIKSLAKDRNNIKSLKKSIQTTLAIFDTINDQTTKRKLEMIDKVFDMFYKNDEATIEFLASAQFNYAVCTDGSSSGSMQYAFDYTVGLKEIVDTLEEFEFLCSIMQFFEGYRLTQDILLHSLAIRLYNLPFYLNHTIKYPKNKLAKLVENLLSPFSRSEKFRVLPDRPKDFYIKTMFKGTYILGYAGKKNKNNFTQIFNPEKFYELSKQRWTPVDLEENPDYIGIIFESAEEYHKIMIHFFYSLVILSH